MKIPLTRIDVMYSFKNPSYDFMKVMFKPLIIAMVFIVIAFICNIILYGWWTSKKIIKPLYRLTHGIETMTQGHYDTRLDFKAEKEFVIIRDAFNYMAETLERTEQKKQDMEASKMCLLTDISHDIKTPMTTIQGYIRALKDGMIKEKDKKTCYETIYRKSLRVDGLINDMFDYVKLENVDYTLHKNLHDFTEFLREVIAEYYQEMEDKSFEVLLNIPEDEIKLPFDYELMNRAITNIIENLIKYNPTGTIVRIELYQGDNNIFLEIADNGVGIPKDVKEHLFDPFVRGDKVRKSDGGSGLGLTISQNIIKKHGGSIEVSNGRPYESTMFTIKLVV